MPHVGRDDRRDSRIDENKKINRNVPLVQSFCHANLIVGSDGMANDRGTLGLYNGNNYPESKTPHMFEWASLAGKEVNDDLVALGTKLELPLLSSSVSA